MAKDSPGQIRHRGRRIVREVHQLRRFHRAEHFTGGSAISVGVVWFNTQGCDADQNENHRNHDGHFHQRKTASPKISIAQTARGIYCFMEADLKTLENVSLMGERLTVLLL